jgi:hypothetical protein
MAKTLNQDTLDQLAEVLEIKETSATAILQSLLTRLFLKAEGLQDAVVAAEDYAGTASQALYGAAANVDRLEDRASAAEANFATMLEERDEARQIAGELLHLLRLADDATFDPTPLDLDFDYLTGSRAKYTCALDRGRHYHQVRP